MGQGFPSLKMTSHDPFVTVYFLPLSDTTDGETREISRTFFEVSHSEPWNFPLVRRWVSPPASSPTEVPDIVIGILTAVIPRGELPKTDLQLHFGSCVMADAARLQFVTTAGSCEVKQMNKRTKAAFQGIWKAIVAKQSEIMKRGKHQGTPVGRYGGLRNITTLQGMTSHISRLEAKLIATRENFFVEANKNGIDGDGHNHDGATDRVFLPVSFIPLNDTQPWEAGSLCVSFFHQVQRTCPTLGRSVYPQPLTAPPAETCGHSLATTTSDDDGRHDVAHQSQLRPQYKRSKYCDEIWVGVLAGDLPRGELTPATDCQIHFGGNAPTDDRWHFVTKPTTAGNTQAEGNGNGVARSVGVDHKDKLSLRAFSNLVDFLQARCDQVAARSTSAAGGGKDKLFEAYDDPRIQSERLTDAITGWGASTAALHNMTVAIPDENDPESDAATLNEAEGKAEEEEEAVVSPLQSPSVEPALGRIPEEDVHFEGEGSEGPEEGVVAVGVSSIVVVGMDDDDGPRDDKGPPMSIGDQYDDAVDNPALDAQDAGKIDPW